MAFYFEMKRTGSTPYVLVDEEKGYMRFEGESYHESISEFFAPVTDWLEAYLTSAFTNLTFDCVLRYFNSSTTKLLYNILLSMSEHRDGKNITVNWITTEDNDHIIECGEDFKDEFSDLAINLILNENEG